MAGTGATHDVSIRSRLAFLVAACVLPVWIAAGYLVYHNYQTKRALTEQHMLDMARALTQVVDRELADLTTDSTVLADSSSLSSGNLAEFYREAQNVVETQPDAHIVLSDKNGQQLINTAWPFGAPLPKRSLPAAVRRVYATGKPVITNVYTAASSKSFRISVEVPVIRDGRVIYDLAMTVPVDRFDKVLRVQQLPPEWVGRIFDSNEVMIARTRLANESAGNPAEPFMGERMREAPEGTIEVGSFEGMLMFDSFSRSATSGWTILIGAPRKLIMAEAWRWLFWAIVGTSLLSITGIAMALLTARRIASSMRALIDLALALGREEPVMIHRLDFAEANEVSKALLRASQLIQERAIERERAGRARREAEELKRLNAKLEQSEAEAWARAAELAAIMDAVPALTLIAKDLECQRITSNRSGYDLLRLQPGSNISRYAPEHERPTNYRVMKNGRELADSELPLQLAAATGREVREFEYTVAYEDGSSRQMFGNAVPLLDDKGAVRGAVGAFIDITERKRAEAALEEREQRLRTILQTAQEAFYLVDSHGSLLEVNDAYCQLSGYRREELLQMRLADLESSENAEEVAEHMKIIIRDGHDRFETRHRHKDGMILDIETSVTFQNSGGGRFVCFLRDITESKRAVQALRESEERFRKVVESSPIGMYIQTEGVFRYLNPAVLKMFAAERPEQLLGQCYLERIHPDFRAAVIERARQVDEENKIAPFLEERFLCLDGGTFDTEVSAIPFTFENRDGALVFVRDITEHKRKEEEKRVLEQQLRQAQKMEAVGRLAGGIAHDFNNLLMVIESYTEMLQQELATSDPLQRNTREIMRAAERAAGLTRQMLAFSRKQIISPVVLDLNAEINETAKMLKRIIGEDIEFRLSLSTELWPIKADSDQVAQVLMNLSVNARDAMPKGGTLTIATENITVTEGSLADKPYVAAGDYVKLSFTDTGMGMSAEIKEQVFEPFFTTKEVGKGTGLGLATVYGIAKQSGGYVWVESEPGHGACFTICIPRANAAATSEVEKVEVSRPGTETILVAEDEAALREAISDFLKGLEYTVLIADSGPQALSIAREHEGRIDLLLTDVVMPKMSGRELSQILGKLRPETKTIYMSGYTDDEILRHGIHESGAAFLQKPFSLGTLAGKVRDIFTKRGVSSEGES